MNKTDQPLVERYNLHLSDSQTKSEFLKTKYQINNFIPMSIGSKKSISSQETRPKTEDSTPISLIDDSDCHEMSHISLDKNEACFSLDKNEARFSSIKEEIGGQPIKQFKFLASSSKSINEVEVCDKINDSIKCCNCF